MMTDRVPAGVVKSLVIGLGYSSVAAAAGEGHVTAVKIHADDVTGIVVGQHENETAARIGPEVDVYRSPASSVK